MVSALVMWLSPRRQPLPSKVRLFRPSSGRITRSRGWSGRGGQNGHVEHRLGPADALGEGVAVAVGRGRHDDAVRVVLGVGRGAAVTGVGTDGRAAQVVDGDAAV